MTEIATSPRMSISRIPRHPTGPAVSPDMDGVPAT